MTRITVNQALLGQLGSGRQEAELCDSAGRRVGYFLPDEVYRQLVCRWANAQVSQEELEAVVKKPEVSRRLKFWIACEILDEVCG